MDDLRDRVRRLVERRIDFMVETFFASTLNFTGPEMALYMLTLCYAWTNGAKLPADEERLQRTLRYDTDEWKRAWPAVSEKWSREGAFLKNRKLTVMYAAAWERTRASVVGGSNGGKAKAASFNKDKGSARGARPRTTTESESESERPSLEGETISSPRSTRQRFAPPSREDVKRFWSEQKLKGDPDDFCDHFENAKWKLSGGRGATMADWRLAARRWSRNDPAFRPRSTDTTPPHVVKKLDLGKETA